MYHKLLSNLAVAVRHGLEQGDPSSDQLLNLTKLNVLRAIMSNMSALGLSFDRVCDDDAVSYFNIVGPRFSSQNLPLSLQPTNLQSSLVHHPWTDPLPFPSLRDILLRHKGGFDEAELCDDVFGLHGPEPVGLLVWTEPWDSNGWEMTEAFARKWMWLFKDCVELQVSTKHWRFRRGEPAF